MANATRATTAADDAAASSPDLDRRETRILIIGVMLALSLAALDQTIIVTALPTIAADLGGAENLSLVVTAYLVTATASAPLYG
jgi:MFS family permease